MYEKIEEDRENGPGPDIARCSKCGWEGPISECYTEIDADWETGVRYTETYCPVCDDGGCVDDFAMSEERAKEYEKWAQKMDWCKKHCLPPAQKWAWDMAEDAYGKKGKEEKR